ncbi:MAG: hypothetical protein A2Y07_02095 [Planctomycetes bacterium GWF2_50_10]|nr:MAG: hypothetical protein A2Y07_02095 [Planctomycetes bacterium GWF2_50_10]
MIYAMLMAALSLGFDYSGDPCSIQQINISMNTEPSTARGINNCIQMAGWGTGGNHATQAYTYYIYYSYTAIPTLGGSSSQAMSINDIGMIVGWTTDTFGKKGAFIYDDPVGTVDLGTLGGDESIANAINNAYQVVGEAKTSAGVFHAFLWQGGQMIDLTTDHKNATSALAINDCGTIVGYLETNGKKVAAILYPSRLILPNLGGPQSQACAINDRSEVVGFSQGINLKPHAFLYAAGRMIDLAPQIEESMALGINNRGDIVGKAMFNSSWKAVLWTQGKIIQLPNAQDIESIAWSINDRGFIAGQATTAFAKYPRAVVWQPPGYTPATLNCN